MIAPSDVESHHRAVLDCDGFEESKELYRFDIHVMIRSGYNHLVPASVSYYFGGKLPGQKLLAHSYGGSYNY